MTAPVLVSACLVGVHSRYDAAACADCGLIERLARQGIPIVPVCPEQLGGLSTPRPPAQIAEGDGRTVLAGDAKVVTAEGVDVTEAYRRGADEVLALAALFGCRCAYLKENSPACGVTSIVRGDQTCPGMGVAAARLRAAGIEVIGVR